MLLCALLAAAGCSAPRARRAVPPVPPVWDITNDVPPVVVSTPAPVAASRESAAISREQQTAALSRDAATVPVPVAPLKPVPQIEYFGSWTSLNHWSEAQGLGTVERVLLPAQPLSPVATNAFKWHDVDLQGTAVIEPLPTFLLKAEAGELILQSGTRQAYWNGVAVGLGFAPKLVQGEVLVRDLDLDNTLKPLLEPSLPLLGDKPRTIVLDPGHGGEDTGCISQSQHTQEKVLTLDWAQRLAPLLQSNGWRVVLTRTNDVALSAAQRVKVADDCQADLFVSLHFDYSGADADRTGVEACCLAPVGVPSSHRAPGGEDPWEVLPNNRYDTQSLRYAYRCQRALVANLGAVDHAVRRVRYPGILTDQERPAVLILGGYLSNPQEAEWIGNAEYRQRLAEALAKGLK